jgi:hypothetical protein
MGRAYCWTACAKALNKSVGCGSKENAGWARPTAAIFGEIGEALRRAGYAKKLRPGFAPAGA